MVSLHSNRTLTKIEVGTGGRVWNGLEKPQDALAGLKGLPQ